MKEAYLETVVPLGFGLEFNGAARATDYSTSGYVTTWKAGATWQPIEDIRLRVTRSRDIRAPNLNELYQAGTANSDSVRNPFFPGVGPGTATFPLSISYSATAVGNLNLRPEKADSWNIGGVVSPRFLPGFSASVDYFRIDLRDAIDTLSAQDIINRCSEGRADACSAFVVDPANNTRLLFRTQPFNFARRLVRGVDFDLSYRLPMNRLFDTVGGNFTLRGVATRYIDSIVTTGLQGAIPVDGVGVLFGGPGLTSQSVTPKWIYRVSAGYDTPSFSITAVGRGVSGGKNFATAVECTAGCPVSTTFAPTYEDNHIPGVFYADLNLTQKIAINDKSQAEFFFNVTNLFDRWPILLPDTGLAANSTYSDLLGRQYRVGFRVALK